MVVGVMKRGSAVALPALRKASMLKRSFGLFGTVVERVRLLLGILQRRGSLVDDMLQLKPRFLLELLNS